MVAFPGPVFFTDITTPELPAAPTGHIAESVPTDMLEHAWISFIPIRQTGDVAISFGFLNF